MLKQIIFVCMLIVCATSLACRRKPPGPPSMADQIKAVIDSIERVTASENQLESLSGSMSQLARFMKDSQIDSGAIFQTQIDYRGFDETEFTSVIDVIDKSSRRVNSNDQVSSETIDHDLVQHFHLSIAKNEKSVAPDKVWDSIRQRFSIEDSQFGTLSAKFINDNIFETETKYEGRFRDQERRVYGIKALQTIQWTKNDNSQWRISKWIQTKFDLKAATSPLFDDVTTTVIPDESTRKNLQRSTHQELLISVANTPGEDLIDLSPDFKHSNDWESYLYPGDHDFRGRS